MFGSQKGEPVNTTSYRWLQAFLWMICAFHIGIGLSVNLFPDLTVMIASVYGAQVDWTPQFVYILRPLGAFMLVMGFLAVVAARKPLENEGIVYCFSALFVIRALQRLIFREDIHAAFAIPSGRNMGAMLFFLTLAAALFGLHRYVKRGDES
jgi:hypothetical protein